VAAPASVSRSIIVAEKAGKDDIVKHIYLSPHSDDVALSCGGQIIADPAREQDIMVLNIFASDPDRSQGGIREKETMFLNADRASEDRSAWESINVATRHANLPEALLRKRFPLAILPRKGDDRIIDELHQAMLTYVRSHPGAVFHFPAGFGNHIDHLVCRTVAFRLLDEGALERIVFYEDIPYCWLRFIRLPCYRALLRDVELEHGSETHAFRHDGETMASYLGQRNVPFPKGKALFSMVYLALKIGNALRGSSVVAKRYRGRISAIRLDDATMERKNHLLYHYRSQIPLLFGDQPDEVLRSRHDAFSTETAIEISRRVAS
jgi:LmbE family N-acetylglucosaminyl deacetylase